MGFSFAFGTEAWRLSFVSDLGWDILIFGFEDKSGAGLRNVRWTGRDARMPLSSTRPA